MKSIIDFALNEEYERVKQLGDRLMEIESVIDWRSFSSNSGGDV
jgi:IS5 family transposase